MKMKYPKPDPNFVPRLDYGTVSGLRKHTAKSLRALDCPVLILKAGKALSPDEDPRPLAVLVPYQQFMELQSFYLKAVFAVEEMERAEFLKEVQS